MPLTITPMLLLVRYASGAIAAAGAARPTAPTPTSSHDTQAFGHGVATNVAPPPTPWAGQAAGIHGVAGAGTSPASALLRRQVPAALASCGSAPGWTGSGK